MHYRATIIGPDYTPYYTCILNIKKIICKDYHFKPPVVSLMMSINHSKIYKAPICLYILL